MGVAGAWGGDEPLSFDVNVPQIRYQWRWKNVTERVEVAGGGLGDRNRVVREGG